MRLFRRKKEIKPKKPPTPAEKAFDLFMALLTPEQRIHLKERGCVYQTAPSGRRYRIDTHTYAGNVWLVDDQNIPEAQLCIHMTRWGDTPRFDHFVAQLLHIRHDEKQFLLRANLQWGSWPRSVRMMRWRAGVSRY